MSNPRALTEPEALAELRAGRGGGLERLLTAAEIADLLGFQPGTIVDWFERGELPGFRPGGRLRFRESEVVAWLEEQRGPGRPSQTPRAVV